MYTILFHDLFSIIFTMQIYQEENCKFQLAQLVKSLMVK